MCVPPLRGVEPSVSTIDEMIKAFPSFSSSAAVVAGRVYLWPVDFTLMGYEAVFGNNQLGTGFLNSFLYMFSGTIASLAVTIMAAYPLSRKELYGRSKLMFFFTFTMMFNGGLIPTYLVVRSVGLIDSRLALIIPGATNAMFMLLVMNSFLSVDKSYYEAAAIDGAGHLSTIFQVILPQAKGMVTVTAINTAIMKWNSWFEASIYVPTDKSKWPLQLWVKQLTSSGMDFLKTQNPDYTRYLIQYAAIVISTVPILIALPFFIKKLEKGMVLGGVKG